MKKLILKISMLGLVIGSFFLSSCEEDLGALFGSNCEGGDCLDLEQFAQNIESTLDGNVVKYSYHIRSGFAVFENAKGPKRTSANPPASNFTLDDRLNPASVTKTITAVALLRALEQNGVSINASIAGYLPSYWNVHPTISTITFKEVLNHTSGFRTSVAGGYTFSNLKTLIETGINISDKVAKYENVNYALARVLLAYVNGYQENQLVDAALISVYFQKYLNDELFSPVGISTINFKPETNGTLFYPFPAGNSSGTSYGDWTGKEGSAGIQISTHELEEFLMRMFTPGTYLSQNMINSLKLYEMGMGEYSGVADGPAYGKGGYFPASYNGGAELNSCIVKFDSGVQAVLIINGTISAKQTLINAYNNAWNSN